MGRANNSSVDTTKGDRLAKKMNEKRNVLKAGFAPDGAEKKEQIVYFADTLDHSLFTKDKMLIRMRRNNEGLDVVAKKRGMSKEDLKFVDEHFSGDEEHTLKFEIDQISSNNKTISCSLRRFIPNIHQSFPFSKEPITLMSQLQKDFIHHFSNHKIRELHYLIPIKSKSFSFPQSYKELE